MRAPLALLGVVLGLAAPAAATPTTASVVMADVDDVVIAEIMQLHDQSGEEPGGIVVPPSPSANLQRAGLKAGDIIIRVNGDRVGSTVSIGWGTTLVEVDRHGQLVLLHLIHPMPKASANLDDDDRNDVVVQIRNVAVAMTKGGKPSGVRIGEPMRDFFSAGDIIRSVDGTQVTSVEELASRFTAGGEVTTVKLDRDDRAYTVEIHRVHAIDLTGIVKVSDTSYQIPQAVVDAYFASPDSIMKGARIVPSMKNGTSDGFKLYAIRPTSAFAKCGLTNGDTITKINGLDLTSPEKALEVYQKLRTAKKFVVDITRRGSPLTLTYTITTGSK